MVNLKEDRSNRVFRALADPTRRKILQAVARRDASAGELAAPFSISAPAISKHLKTLEKADLVRRVKEGQTHRFSLNVATLQDAEDTIRRLTGYWNRRLGNLKEFLESEEPVPQSGETEKRKKRNERK